MSQQPREGTHYRQRGGWTERQSQVLNMLARGRTNAEIAESLGLSLDGAKYHVSEVMGKLGVGTREEAAEYWRAYNGWPQRLRRFVATIFARGLVVRLAAAGAASLVIFLAAVAVLPTLVGGDRRETSDELEPTATATTDIQTATAQPEITPGAPQPAPLGEIGGVAVRQLTLGGELPLPPRTVLYYHRGCYGCGQWPFIWRAYVDESGVLFNEPITPTPSTEGGIDGFAIDEGGGYAFATFCRGYCGGEAESQPGSTKVARLSTDGGLTWEDGNALPVNTFPLFRYEGQWVLQTWDEETRTVRFWLYETGATIEPPAGLESGRPLLLSPDRIAWRVVGAGREDPPQYYDQEGRPLGIWPIPGRTGDVIASAATRLLLVQSYPTGPLSPGSPMYLAVEDETGTVRASLSWGASWIGHVEPLSAGLMVATAEIPWELYPPDTNPGPPGGEPVLNFDVRVVLIDSESATLHPIAGLPRGPDGEWEFPGWAAHHNYAYPRRMVPAEGPLLRVATNGSCLNVRESATPEAGIIRCYRDGVLLTEVAVDETAEGWLRVRTPDGREGWVATEYLAR